MRSYQVLRRSVRNGIQVSSATLSTTLPLSALAFLEIVIASLLLLGNS